MRDFIKKRTNFIILIILFLTIFGLGYFSGKSSIVCKVCPPEKVDFSLFWEAWDRLSKEYIDSSKLDTKKMIYGAISGMTDSLEDPYTAFFTPEKGKNFLEEVEGSFEGVGMEVGKRQGQIQVIAPLEGTPAQKAGLIAGDRILKIDDKFTTNMTIEEAVSYIKGPKDTEVVLTIERNGWDTPREFKIKRAVIEIPSVTWEIKNNGKEDVAYIKIHHFNRNTDYKFYQAANAILKTSAKKIVLDLRNNPGGYLEISVNIAGWFLPRNQVVVIEDFGEKRKGIPFKTTGNSIFLEYPIVVLINEGTASASEILAAALREVRDAKLVGKKSFGKGSVQEMQILSDGSSLKITIAHWLTPQGLLIAEKGLDPDVEVEITEKDYEEKKDPQLDKALEILKEIE